MTLPAVQPLALVADADAQACGPGTSPGPSPNPSPSANSSLGQHLLQLSFPTNVYAALLQWSEGRVEHLHCGLFDGVDEPVWQAQARANQRLRALMPPPCRVLKVGIGLGSILRELGAAGYDVLGITPCAFRSAAAQARHGAAIQVEVVQLEDLPTPAKPWDLMLLHESLKLSEPLALFEAADRLLVNEGATLLLMDEFALQRGSAEHTGLPLYLNFVELAGRFGWRLEHEQDVSGQAAHTLSAILRMLGQHRQRLIDELGLPAAVLDTLARALHHQRALYAQGVHGYRLLRLHRPSAPALRLGRIGAGQAAGMRELFARSFGHALSAEEWAWKYGEGRGCAVGLWQGPKLVAHYGGLSRPVLLMGEPALGCQVGDVMVAPEVNAGLARHGALYAVTATLLEAEIGWAMRHAVGFGFPNARAMRLAQRLGLYAPVDDIVAMAWTALTPVPSTEASAGLHLIDIADLVEATAVWAELAGLWVTMSSALRESALGVRDPAWLRHRYGRRPGVRYELLACRDAASGPLRGVAVLRQHAQSLELMDLVGHPSQFPALVKQVRHEVHRRGCLRLDAWVTRSHAHLLDDACDPAQYLPLDVTVPANAHSLGFEPARLLGRWFLMSGDTDFR